MHILAPLSLLYRVVTDIRNWMFDHGWLKERRYDIPIICIGNLVVGGTGKTPHCEWLVGYLLKQGKRVAILSRGYGRKTRGFVEATGESHADNIGDEPLQLYLQFEGRAIVAVCEDRCHGIERLLTTHSDIDIIVLDDAFQHRYVHPSCRLLLTDYSRLYITDHLMPWGRLRESRRGAERADAIIVTKCPADLSAEEQQNIAATLKPGECQQVFFTTMEYASLPELQANPQARIALLAGIAHPEPFRRHFEDEGYYVCASLFYADHHNFTTTDITRIEATAAKVDYIITTAKDHARLQSLNLSQATSRKILVQHISVSVLNDETTLLKSIALC